MSITSASKWSKLASPNFFKIAQLTNVKLNDCEFAILAWNGIQKYNILENKWSQFVDLNHHFDVYRKIPKFMAFDEHQQKLYISSGKQLITVDVKEEKKNYKYYKCNNITFSVKFSVPMIINNKLNVVGGSTNQHLIWNEQQTKYDIHHKFQEFSKKIGHNLIYLKSKKILLCFGGVNDHNKTDTIYSFNIQSSKWTKLELKLPVANCLFGCISTRNEQYVILFGGITDGVCTIFHREINNIYILNTKTMKFKESEICCPVKGKYEAINMNSALNEKLLCFGYIRQLWDIDQFCDLTHIPFYLIQLIQQYITIEIVHLINLTSREHWKINVDDLL